MSRSERSNIHINQSLINACQFDPNLTHGETNLSRRELRHKYGTGVLSHARGDIAKSTPA